MEFDILMQYYNKLRDQMSLIDSQKLHDWFCCAGIITRTSRNYTPEMKIAKMASHLLSGTYIFHIMLETLRNHSDIFHDLVSEIQVVLDQKLLTGMYVCM